MSIKAPNKHGACGRPPSDLPQSLRAAKAIETGPSPKSANSAQKSMVKKHLLPCVSLAWQLD
jgi:hypothetical protein